MIDQTAEAILAELAVKNAPVLNLLELCRTPEYADRVWSEGPALARRFARLLLKQGHPTMALEVASRSVAGSAGVAPRHPQDHDLLYCRALALARCGNPTSANWFVQELLKRNDLPDGIRIEAVSLAGRVCKDLAVRSANPAVRVRRFREAFGYYQKAYEPKKDTFPGVNAATLALLAGEREVSRTLAVEVRDKALDELDRSGGSDFWALATLGEAYLLLGDQTASKGRYAKAVRIARDEHNAGDITSMFRQLLLIKDCLPVGDDLLELFRLGPIVVFAGHGLDYPGDPVRFPPNTDLEAAVRRAIKHELDALETNIGYYIPGCGSDVLFGELMKERDAESHMVLPFAENDLCNDRLTYCLPEFEPWQKRYEVLKGFLRATKHFATTEPFLNDRVLYDFAGTFMQGLALTRAAQVGSEAVALVVQDSTPQPKSSGLTTFIANWKKTGRKLRVIDLAEKRASVNLAASPAEARERAFESEPQRTVQTMLFADVAGFSEFTEENLPKFFMPFLALVEDELKTTRTLFQNTWGDGLYIVFDDVLTCADFALRLLRRLEGFNFKALGFKDKEDKKPGVRIGLHTGPVFEGYDAVIGKNNYFGSHVSRAARIEPVTTPGCAFVSEQFAATLALVPDHDFVCEYLGLVPLAKGYDVCPLYRLTTRLDRE